MTEEPIDPRYFTESQHEQLAASAAKIRDGAAWFIADCDSVRFYDDDHSQQELLEDAMVVEKLATALRQEVEGFIAGEPQDPEN